MNDLVSKKIRYAIIEHFAASEIVRLFNESELNRVTILGHIPHATTHGILTHELKDDCILDHLIQVRYKYEKSIKDYAVSQLVSCYD